MYSRVHWFILNLPLCIKRNYKLFFDYEYHNYTLLRYPYGKKWGSPVDLFVIIRTSRRCWRGMYFHFEYNYFEYFSAQTSKKVCERMESIYRKIFASECENERKERGR